MQLEKISRIAQHTAKTIIRIEDVKYKLMKTEQIIRQRGKTQEIKVCECKIDLLAITETWLTANDDAVRNELCPTNYKLCDYSRTDRILSLIHI